MYGAIAFIFLTHFRFSLLGEAGEGAPGLPRAVTDPARLPLNCSQMQNPNTINNLQAGSQGRRAKERITAQQLKVPREDSPLNLNPELKVCPSPESAAAKLSAGSRASLACLGLGEHSDVAWAGRAKCLT